MYCDRNTGFTAFTTFRPATEECQRHLAVIRPLRMNKDLHSTVFRLAHEKGGEGAEGGGSVRLMLDRAR